MVWLAIYLTVHILFGVTLLACRYLLGLMGPAHYGMDPADAPTFRFLCVLFALLGPVGLLVYYLLPLEIRVTEVDLDSAPIVVRRDVPPCGCSSQDEAPSSGDCTDD